MPGHDHAGDLRVDGARGSDELDPVDVGHHQVGQQQLMLTGSQIA